MTLLSRKADYALLILSYLHRKPVGGNARAIAQQFGLSRAFVANILKELCHNGYVTSHRGVKGGYVLHPSAADVTLAELLESIDERFRLTMCSPACNDSRRSRRNSSGPDRPWLRSSSSASRTATISSLSSRPAAACVPSAGGQSIPDTGSATRAVSPVTGTAGD